MNQHEANQIDKKQQHQMGISPGNNDTVRGLHRNDSTPRESGPGFQVGAAIFHIQPPEKSKVEHDADDLCQRIQHMQMQIENLRHERDLVLKEDTALRMERDALKGEVAQLREALKCSEENRVNESFEQAVDRVIHQLCEQAHATAVSKSWYDKPVDMPTHIALVHSELSEALEEYRALQTLNVGGIRFERKTMPNGQLGSPEPKGVDIEFADAAIRIFDLCRYHGIDLAHAIRVKMAFNATRPPRHGGKRC